MVPLKLKLPDSFFEEEIRCDHKITREMKEVWAVNLDLINEFMRVCNENDIPFFMYYGSLLGAVRHNGFIPWDDDVDLILSRKDYEKLCKIAPKAFKYPYFLQTEYSDVGFSRTFARLHNSDTTGAIGWENDDGFIHYNQGVFIDIFVYDEVPADQEERERWIRKLTWLHNRAMGFSVWTTRYRENAIRHGGKLYRRIRKGIAIVLQFLIEHLHICNPFTVMYTRLSRRYFGKNTGLIADLHLFFDQGACVFDESIFAEAVYMPFETLSVPVPAGYEHILESRYGDWRKLVKSPSHSRIYDLDTPYKEYFARLRREKKRK